MVRVTPVGFGPVQFSMGGSVSRYLLSVVIMIVAFAAGLTPARAQSEKAAAANSPVSSATSSAADSSAQGASTTSEQAPASAAADSKGQPADQVDPLKRKPNEKQKKAQKRGLNIELSKTYKKWLNEDVVWIITDEERAAFKQLSNDEERDNFIEAFWQRRDPTPDTEENEYKEEHYRRIAYANEHFAAGIPAGRPIAAACTSCMVPRMKSILIPPVDPTSARRKKAGVKPQPSLLKTGAIVISRVSVRKLLSNS